MISAGSFLAELRSAGFGLASGVPCSDLGALLPALAATPDVRWIGAANEGDAVAIATGAVIGGTRALALMQNSGLGNAVNPLTSLSLVFRLPVLLVVAWRGEPDGRADEPQHEVMGRITTQLLGLMGIAWERLPADDAALSGAFARATARLDAGTPYAFVVAPGTVEASSEATEASSEAMAASSEATEASSDAIEASSGAMAAASPPASWADGIGLGVGAWPSTRPTRREAIAAVQRGLGPDDVLLATTGYSGREMVTLDDRPNQLAMVGSMGCVSSLALGLACVCPDRVVVVLDGDGAALMRLGALATLGAERPPNLVHVLLDNEAHESTGGQPTAAATTDLGAVARACGYPRVVRAGSAAKLHDLVATTSGELTFVHVKTAAAGDPAPPRPVTPPAEAAARLMAWLR